ncbi:uncharacterized protein si:dkeyp-97a10.2 isoform X2 [Amphiprion ocellaris]|uniref:uncharacterized protein si:dkeyp-97a10.2 isoform X2 n=1 Tax=Amphiprion ocellaris TaxID=80972 RepID=UPI002410EBCF|nr:uncharacterized protein si:dkeyp-97a10.2 isoform X2 [Amphiprion ocellaris]
MDLQYFLCWRVAPLFFLMPCGLQSMSVHILSEQPVHVIPGSRLVLKARIELGPLEEVSMVTWEREPETGIAPVRVTLATCAGRSLKCAGTRPTVDVNTEQQETTLQINRYSREDGGVYAVTVTDHTGTNTTAHCIVREYDDSGLIVAFKFSAKASMLLPSSVCSNGINSSAPLFSTSALSASRVFHHPIFQHYASLSDLIIVSETEPVSPDSIKCLS